MNWDRLAELQAEDPGLQPLLASANQNKELQDKIPKFEFKNNLLMKTQSHIGNTKILMRIVFAEGDYSHHKTVGYGQFSSICCPSAMSIKERQRENMFSTSTNMCVS
ncbi:hypothetical protein TNCT_339121 [Trichonephila clavata]|uniref:Uncharacterized protein n=1 Tax=Trichonephila clavata TaxID=2740835 RepID=A0A8X6KQI4_TRICU|nr:hypothetical protein TNCT_339121 [Trichonephila clavata]